MSTKEVISWDAIREHKLSKVEERTLNECFSQYISGNSFYSENEFSSPEMEQYFELFKQGWVMHDLFIQGK